ncbi:MAG: carboxypeptidase-like regulatory domain-containing protein [Flavobacteriaceae bacterium]|nr:MAG: carboxypeptidase-like regulatory domain-containing protein [Flavobacteriaceae bacterium]
MNKKLLYILIFFTLGTQAQTKVQGFIVDNTGASVPFANIIFKGSTEGTISDENGKFYLESSNDYRELEVSFVGFETKTVAVSASNYELKIVLDEARDQLKEVRVYSGRIRKKNNPAIDLLKKIWAQKRRNGLNMYDRFEFDRYEKIEFDLNNIDEKLMERKVFEGMEMVFDQIDTSKITGKVFLPIFINESVYKTYGKNIYPRKNNSIMIANKNSGYSDNQALISFLKQLYVDFDIYDNYLLFFDKKFSSPLSKLGPDVYNYVLTDSAYIDNKWCYNILFYPRRKNELTFKGDFWVSDTTYAIKEIQMYATKNANVNWVKDIYIEQEYEVLNDSVFLLKRDYIMTDFALNQKDKSKGVYGKRTTLFDNHVFDVKRPEEFYKEQIQDNEEMYNQPDDFWEKNRQEQLTENEIGIYKMLDTLQTVKRFQQINTIGEILASGYWNFTHGWDFGPVFSTIGYNDIEGLRLKAGARTYFSQNDKWRVKGYLAYGFMDAKFKYGIEGKYLFNGRDRWVLSLGTRKDIEQLGVSLTTANEVLERSFATTSIFTRGDNSKLSNIDLTNFKVNVEPVKNLELRLGTTYKTLESADPSRFNVDYYDESGEIQSSIEQVDVSFGVQYTPKRKAYGFGVERSVSNSGRFPTFFVSYTRGIKGVFNSDFDYHKLQFYYEQPMQLGLFGRLTSTFEIGKTINPVPLQLLNIVPGNQTFFTSRKLFDLLDYYEFVTDEYVSLHLEHNFNGKIFAKIPWIRDLQWREIIGVRGVVGGISQENRDINASDIIYVAPENIYWEYHFGIGNIFKLLRVDFEYRGSYRDRPGATNFAVKIGLGFYF